MFKAEWVTITITITSTSTITITITITIEGAFYSLLLNMRLSKNSARILYLQPYRGSGNGGRHFFHNLG